jgi:uncharacterized protein with HEPN domain
MREPARDKGRLEHILEAANYVMSFSAGLNYESFLSDKLRYFAILKNVEIIGEAAYMLSLEFKESHPEVPWGQMIRMRHVLVHGYASVLPEMLWQTAMQDIPLLRPQIEAIWKDMP